MLNRQVGERTDRTGKLPDRVFVRSTTEQPVFYTYGTLGMINQGPPITKHVVYESVEQCPTETLVAEYKLVGLRKITRAPVVTDATATPVQDAIKASESAADATNP